MAEKWTDIDVEMEIVGLKDLTIKLIRMVDQMNKKLDYIDRKTDALIKKMNEPKTYRLNVQ